MIEQKRIDEIRQAGIDAGFGHNTHDLTRRYAKDIKTLLDERQELLDELDRYKKVLLEEQARTASKMSMIEHGEASITPMMSIDIAAASNLQEEVDG